MAEDPTTARGAPCDLLVADSGNHAIRRVSRGGGGGGGGGGLVTTVAGRPSPQTRNQSVDGDAEFIARFNEPTALAVASDGAIYVGEARRRAPECHGPILPNPSHLRAQASSHSQARS